MQDLANTGTGGIGDLTDWVMPSLSTTLKSTNQSIEAMNSEINAMVPAPSPTAEAPQKPTNSPAPTTPKTAKRKYTKKVKEQKRPKCSGCGKDDQVVKNGKNLYGEQVYFCRRCGAKANPKRGVN